MLFLPILFDMKRKLLTALCLMIIALFCAFLYSSCQNSGNNGVISRSEGNSNGNNNGGNDILPKDGEDIIPPNGNAENPDGGNGTATDDRYTPQDYFYYEKTDGKVTVTGLTEDAPKTVKVPSEIDGNTVFSVADRAFADCKFTSLTLPVSLEYIGSGALCGCTFLEELTLPFVGAKPAGEGKTGNYPFGYIFGRESRDNCVKTTQYFFGSSSEYVDSEDYYIPLSLKTVTVSGKNAAILPYSSFYNCSSLARIVIDGNTEKIGKFAFSGCVAEIVWEDGNAEEVSEYAFSDYKGTSITLPAGLKTFARCAFSACVNLKSFTVPDTVEEIAPFAFSYCYDLKDFNMGSSVKTVGVCAFYFCIKLKNVTLSDGLDFIDDYAFSACKAMEEFTVKNGVRRIGTGAFIGCEKLKKLYFDDPDGWVYFNRYSSGEKLSVKEMSDPSLCAKRLSVKMSDYIWAKKAED